MVQFLLQLAKATGVSTAKAWSQIHTFLPDDEEKLSRRGQLLAVVSLRSLTEEAEIVSFGREVISRLHEEYYGQLGDSSFKRLSASVEKVVAEVGSEAEVEMTVAALVGPVLFVVIVGNGKLFMLRSRQMVNLLSGQGTSSGYLQAGDLFFLGTGGVFEIMDRKALKDALKAGSPQEAVDVLAPLIHSQKESGTMAGLVAKVGPGGAEIDGAMVEEEGKIDSQMEKPVLARIRDLSLKLKKKLKSRKSSVEDESKKRLRKKWVRLALFLFLVLLVSVYLGQQKKQRLQKENRWQVLLQQAQGRKEEGEALLQLNPLRAKELLLEAQGLIDQIEPEEKASGTVAGFSQDLEALLAQVIREYQVEPEVFFDLGLIKNEARGSDWDSSAGRLVILDQGKQTAYFLGLADKKSAILAGGLSLEGAKEIAAFSETTFVLVKEGIIQVKGEAKKSDLVVKTDESWGEIADLAVFGGNLYLLDEKGAIWKYPATEEGFGSRQAWLGEETDFSRAVSMAIDGAIWILLSDGTIHKYLQGEREAFGLAGLNKPLGESALLYTNDQQENLYLLDRGNFRVVVLAKSGEYQAEYQWSGMGEVEGLLALEEEKKLFLLRGSKIYEVKMR